MTSPKQATMHETLIRALDLSATLSERPGLDKAAIRQTVYRDTLPQKSTSESERRTLEERFDKSFARDRKLLESQNIFITKREYNGTVTYSIDDKRSFINYRDVFLDGVEPALILVATTTMVDDPLFPLGQDLKVATLRLEKALMSEYGDDLPRAHSHLSTDTNSDSLSSPSDGALNQYEVAPLVMNALFEQYAVECAYENTSGVRSARTVCPYGMFLLDGRWYVTGHDSKTDSVRTFALIRMASVTPTDISYERPEDFDIRTQVQLPFALDESAPNTPIDVCIPANRTALVQTITRNKGMLAEQEDGSLQWTVGYQDLKKFGGYLVEEGLRLSNLQTIEANEITVYLEKVVRDHV